MFDEFATSQELPVLQSGNMGKNSDFQRPLLKSCMVYPGSGCDNLLNISVRCRNFPTLPMVGLRPDAIPARSENTVRIESILQGLVESTKRLVVPSTGSSDLMSEKNVCFVFAISFFSACCDEVAHKSRCTTFLVEIRSIVNNIGNVMRLAASNS